MKNILVVDGHQEYAHYLKAYLVEEGYQVAVAFSGAEAVEKIQFTNFSLILLDLEVEMAQLKAMEFLEHIKRLYPEIPVIMISELDSRELVVEAAKRGAYDFLIKGCSVEEIRLVVRKSLERRRSGIKDNLLFTQLQEKNRKLEWEIKELSVLYEIARNFGSQLTLDESLGRLSLAIRQVIPVDYYICFSFQAEVRELKVRFAHGVSEDILKGLSAGKMSMEVSSVMNGNTQGEVTGSFTGHLLSYFKENELCDLLTESFLSFPIMIDNELYGIFCAGSATPDVFSLPDERQFLSIIASQAVSLYEKASCIAKSTRLIAMGELISEIAHDLRHPITKMKGALQNLEGRWYDDDFRNKSMEIVNDSLFRLSALVKELLVFSNSPTKFQKKRVDLNATLDRVLNLVKNDLYQHKISLIRESIQDVSPTCVNEERIKESFLNIIVNAIEAMPQGGELRVWARNFSPDNFQQKYVVVNFTDTGVGIPQKIQKKIFEHFFTTKEAGTGLGLAAANQVIQAHNGYIEVQSEVNKGTTFMLYLPVSKE
jgi:K+-sensing histidine kinase KdpD/CheY-like chemotaxis protein